MVASGIACDLAHRLTSTGRSNAHVQVNVLISPARQRARVTVRASPMGCMTQHKLHRVCLGQTC